MDLVEVQQEEDEIETLTKMKKFNNRIFFSKVVPFNLFQEMADSQTPHSDTAPNIHPRIAIGAGRLGYLCLIGARERGLPRRSERRASPPDHLT